MVSITHVSSLLEMMKRFAVKFLFVSGEKKQSCYTQSCKRSERSADNKVIFYGFFLNAGSCLSHLPTPKFETFEIFVTMDKKMG